MIFRWIILTIWLSACQSKKWTRSDLRDIGDEKSKIGLAANYIKTDSNTIAICLVGKDTVYRLRGFNTVPDTSNRVNTIENDLCIDGIEYTIDGGKNWLNESGKDTIKGKVMDFMVGRSGEIKYLLTSVGVYGSGQKRKFIRIDSIDVASPFRNSIYEYDPDAAKLNLMDPFYRRPFTVVRFEHDFYTIYDSSLMSGEPIGKRIAVNVYAENKKLPPAGWSVTTPSGGSDYAIYNDTLFCKYRHVEGVLIKKYNDHGLITEKFTTLKTSLPLIRPFVTAKRYFLLAGTNDKDTQFRKLYHSGNFGMSWDSIHIESGLEFLENYSSQELLTFFRLPEYETINTNFRILDLSTLKWASYTDSTLRNDFTRSVYPSPSNTNLILLAKDSNQKTTGIYITYKKDLDSFQKIDKYTLNESNSQIKLRFKLSPGLPLPQVLKLQVYGANAFDLDEKRPYKYLGTSKLNTDSGLFSFSFPPSRLNLHDKEKYSLKLFLAEGATGKYYLLNRSFVPVNFFKKYRTQILIAAPFLLAILVLLTLFIVRPYSIYQLYSRQHKLRELETLPNGVGPIIKLFNWISLVPHLAAKPRVLDAWVSRNKQKITDYYLQKEETVKKHQLYIPLPVRVQSPAGTEIEKPSPQTMGEFFRHERASVEIIGLGGIGKTTLAVQLGGWVMNSRNAFYFDNHIMLPVMVEEETTDVPGAVARKLRMMMGEKTDPHFLSLLLKYKRILVIIDALSERSREMQDRIKKLYRSEDINAMIITSRHPVRVESGEEILLYPQPMNSFRVLAYINSLDQSMESSILRAESRKISLLAKIIDIFCLENEQLPILPVLVTIILDKVVELSALNPGIEDFDQLLNNLPATIPDIYSDYILKVNPDKGENIFSDDDILLAAEISAELSVGEQFYPTDAKVEDLSPLLKKAIHHPPQAIISRLVDNGILIRRKYANNNFLRFALDPMAEYLAAIRLAKRCGSDSEKWKELYKRVQQHQATSFLDILKIVHLSFAKKYRWWLPYDYGLFINRFKA